MSMALASSSSSSSWSVMELLLARIKERNARETGLGSIVQDYDLLWKQNMACEVKRKELERELVIAKNKANNSGSMLSTSPAMAAAAAFEASKEKMDMERKLFKLQEELSAKYKEGEQKAISQLKLIEDMQHLKRKYEDNVEALKNSQAQTQTLQIKLAKQEKEIAEMNVLRKELENLRKRCADSEQRERDLEKRLITEKTEMSAEIARMTKEFHEVLSASKISMSPKPTKEETNKPSETAPGTSAATTSASAAAVADVGVSRIGFHVTRVPKKVMYSFKAHETEIPSICFTDNGDSLVTGSCDGKVSLWDSATGTHTSSFYPSTSFSFDGSPSSSPNVGQPVMCVDQRGDLILAGSVDRTCRVWSIETQRLLHSLSGHAGKIYAVHISPDCKFVVTGSVDRKVMTWDMKTGSRVRTILPGSICNSLDISEDGYTLVTGHQDRSVRLFDLRNGQLTQSCDTAHAGIITSTKFSPDHRTILTSSRDNSLCLIDMRYMEKSPLIRFHHEDYETAFNWSRADFSPDCKYVTAGGANGSLFVWDTSITGATPAAEGQPDRTPIGKIKQIIQNRTAPLACAAWNPRGMTVATCDKDGYISILGQE